MLPKRAAGLWPGLTLRIGEDCDAMSRLAAEQVLRVVRARPAALLCLATGATPARTYERLVAAGRRHRALFRRVRVVTLDEWGGLSTRDPATCAAYLRQKFCGPLAIDGDRCARWRSRPRDAAREVRRMTAWLAEHGPIDLSVLGLGVNGHLGFNEPGSALHDGPHVARLSAASLRHAMLHSARRPVEFGLTLGIGDLCRSRAVLLLVSGAHKARQLRRLLLGLVTPRFPASFLRLHGAVTICCDRAAAALLPEELSTCR